jgi:mannonate dehydratase
MSRPSPDRRGCVANLCRSPLCAQNGVGCASFTTAAHPRSLPGTPEIRGSMMWTNDQPGLGLDIDETLAANYPYPSYSLNGSFPPHRPDSSVIRR